MSQQVGTISELAVVEFLLENTAASFPSVQWHQKDSGGFITSQRGVWIHLQREQNTTGSRLFLALFSDFQTVYITEPRPRTLRGGFSTSEDSRLAQSMHRLERVVVEQCLRQRAVAPDSDEPVRSMVFRQLMSQESKT